MLKTSVVHERQLYEGPRERRRRGLLIVIAPDRRSFRDYAALAREIGSGGAPRGFTEKAEVDVPSP